MGSGAERTRSKVALKDWDGKAEADRVGPPKFAC